jgi:hypothetical protein
MKIAILIVLLSASAMACPKGSTEYEGNCAIDLPVAESEKPVAPSDEKPPTDKMPSYEREGVHALMPPSLVAQDEKEDQQRAQATDEGKKAAGIQ